MQIYKKMGNQITLYDEPKTVQFNGKITQTAMAGLKILSLELHISRQELYEQLGRRGLPPELFPSNIPVVKKKFVRYPGAIAPQLYPEPKDTQYNARITPTAAQGLKLLSCELELSKQEIIERLGRRLLPRRIFIEKNIEDKND